MRNKSMLYVFSICVVFVVISLLYPIISEAVRWEYPSGSILGTCLTSKGIYKLFPDRDSAMEAWNADYMQALNEYRANPQLPYPRMWEWACYCPYWCNCTSQWSCPVCDCGFTCINCANAEPAPNGHTYYWYPRFDCPNNCIYTYPPPSQQPDVPATTEVPDKNTGGPCEGTCNTTVDDSNKGANP